jgi:putative sigma-54 modulation protein
MDVFITVRHLEGTEGIRQYTEQKAEKLKKYLLEPANLHVTFSLERYRHRVDIVLSEKRHLLKAQGITNNMYASIDAAMHNLEEQLKKYKEKIKGHHFLKTFLEKIRSYKKRAA